MDENILVNVEEFPFEAGGTVVVVGVVIVVVAVLVGVGAREDVVSTGVSVDSVLPNVVRVADNRVEGVAEGRGEEPGKGEAGGGASDSSMRKLTQSSARLSPWGRKRREKCVLC